MVKPILMKMTAAELFVALQIGGLCQIDGITKGRKKNEYSDKSDWATDINAALTEMAFAKYLGIYWNPSFNTFKRPDVAGYQVRSTTWTHGHLIVRNVDDINDTFILGIVDEGCVSLIGKIAGTVAKTEKYRHEGKPGEPPIWWVPQGVLEDLPRQIVSINPPLKTVA